MTVSHTNTADTSYNGSSDNTIRIWNAVSGEKLAQLDSHTSNICSVGFSPDEQRIISGSADGTVERGQCQSSES
ncbi:MAG: hypothetical protein AAF639_21560 [Chloroflexota bacterium]